MHSDVCDSLISLLYRLLYWSHNMSLCCPVFWKHSSVSLTVFHKASAAVMLLVAYWVIASWVLLVYLSGQAVDSSVCLPAKVWKDQLHAFLHIWTFKFYIHVCDFLTCWLDTILVLCSCTATTLHIPHIVFKLKITKKKLQCEMCGLTVHEIYCAGTVPGLQVSGSHNTVAVFRGLDM